MPTILNWMSCKRRPTGLFAMEVGQGQVLTKAVVECGSRHFVDVERDRELPCEFVGDMFWPLYGLAEGRIDGIGYELLAAGLRKDTATVRMVGSVLEQRKCTVCGRRCWASLQPSFR